MEERPFEATPLDFWLALVSAKVTGFRAQVVDSALYTMLQPSLSMPRVEWHGSTKSLPAMTPKNCPRAYRKREGTVEPQITMSIVDPAYVATVEETERTEGIDAALQLCSEFLYKLKLFTPIKGCANWQCSGVKQLDSSDATRVIARACEIVGDVCKCTLTSSPITIEMQNFQFYIRHRTRQLSSRGLIAACDAAIKRGEPERMPLQKVVHDAEKSEVKVFFKLPPRQFVPARTAGRRARQEKDITTAVHGGGLIRLYGVKSVDIAEELRCFYVRMYEEHHDTIFPPPITAGLPVSQPHELEVVAVQRAYAYACQVWKDMGGEGAAPLRYVRGRFEPAVFDADEDDADEAGETDDDGDDDAGDDGDDDADDDGAAADAAVEA